ncbi:hypothetical protein [Polynucleobacter sp. AP-Kolm-20A-A1]|uniref:hypothetical protein n=1 Tax=Polynucleobacter sp. AP-Kolm-20A-A1 TaxID=2081041 RepID=UPI001BFD1ECA|nr:hypothetical protein [Polynucleobacter sp. AP-Kolm-20A-A1]QWE20909.1 hypothetical protein C2745_01575 [Polynucleobacter sp. AP-Kolm-20A-A1]
MFRTFTYVIFLLALISCIGVPDQNEDPAKNNRATYRQDLKECNEVYPETGSGVHLKQRDGCMRLKGWK